MARKNVTFFLGYAPAGAGLASRLLRVRKVRRAGDDAEHAYSYNSSESGTTEFVTVALTDNFLWEATLLDTATAGGTRSLQVLHFNTGSLFYPGPKSNQGDLSVYKMEDLSSSSESSTNSSASSVSASSQSSPSSSLSSISPSSVSSQSSSSVSSQSSSSSSSTNSSSSSVSSWNSSSSSSSLSSSSVSSSSASSSS